MVLFREHHDTYWYLLERSEASSISTQSLYGYSLTNIRRRSKSYTIHDRLRLKAFYFSYVDLIEVEKINRNILSRYLFWSA